MAFKGHRFQTFKYDILARKKGHRAWSEWSATDDRERAEWHKNNIIKLGYEALITERIAKHIEKWNDIRDADDILPCGTEVIVKLTTMRKAKATFCGQKCFMAYGVDLSPEVLAWRMPFPDEYDPDITTVVFSPELDNLDK